MARRMFLLKECDALLCREGGLDRGRSSKLESLAEVARLNEFGTPKLEGLSRWVGCMMPETFAKGEQVRRRLIITVETGIDWESVNRS
jgi:hypothetical protein